MCTSLLAVLFLVELFVRVRHRPGLLDAFGVAASVGLLHVYMDGAFGTVCGIDRGAADVVCCMQRYDNGIVGSSPCSFYGCSNLCQRLSSQCV